MNDDVGLRFTVPATPIPVIIFVKKMSLGLPMRLAYLGRTTS